MQKIPVLVTSFIRPNFLMSILEIIEKRSDIDLYFATDGPRNNDDKIKINKCLNIIKQSKFKFNSKNMLVREQNYGTKFGIKNNIDWFFSKNKLGIVLEDDCLPDNTFFDAIFEGLKIHKNSSKYMSVSGSDYFPINSNQSKTFYRDSYFPMVWGWGSWSDKWNLYKLDIPDLNILVNKTANKIYGEKNTLEKILFVDVFKKRFTEVNTGLINTWDYSLMASAWRNDMVCLQSNFNMIINLGFGKDAAHTTGNPPDWVPKEYRSLKNYLDYTVVDLDYINYDKWLAKNVYNCTPREFIKNGIKRIINL